MGQDEGAGEDFAELTADIARLLYGTVRSDNLKGLEDELRGLVYSVRSVERQSDTLPPPHEIRNQLQSIHNACRELELAINTIHADTWMMIANSPNLRRADEHGELPALARDMVKFANLETRESAGALAQFVALLPALGNSARESIQAYENPETFPGPKFPALLRAVQGFWMIYSVATQKEPGKSAKGAFVGGIQQIMQAAFPEETELVTGDRVKRAVERLEELKASRRKFIK